MGELMALEEEAKKSRKLRLSLLIREEMVTVGGDVKEKFSGALFLPLP